jgi:cobalt-precorrin-5B (C1)-methyltransferase
MAKRLRSGYTTGACAAAAAKAAALVARDGTLPDSVELVFPDDSVHSFAVHRAERTPEGGKASVIKDAGDDPDVTNRAEIVATVNFSDKEISSQDDWIVLENVQISAGIGVGTVTKPGLAVPPGQPAINPVPRQMICKAVQQVESRKTVHVSISIPRGEELAEKTLNHRLGIMGGLSILGTTGIVRPVSADAWKATIEASMNVAREAGLEDIVLSTGRTSEKGAQSLLELAIEAYAMMGDYLEFSLRKAGEKDFKTIHLAGMWAKIMKAAMQIPQTHVRNGALEIKDAAAMLEDYGVEKPLLDKLRDSNTAREMYTHLEEAKRQDVIHAVLVKAQHYGRKVSNKEVRVYLVDARAKVVAHV